MWVKLFMWFETRRSVVWRSNIYIIYMDGPMVGSFSWAKTDRPTDRPIDRSSQDYFQLMTKFSRLTRSHQTKTKEGKKEKERWRNFNITVRHNTIQWTHTLTQVTVLWTIPCERALAGPGTRKLYRHDWDTVRTWTRRLAHGTITSVSQHVVLYKGLFTFKLKIESIYRGDMRMRDVCPWSCVVFLSYSLLKRFSNVSKEMSFDSWMKQQ